MKCFVTTKVIFLNTTALLSEAGNMFHEKIVEGIGESDNVIIDMTGITALPSVFLNVSIGRLIDEWGMEKLKSSLTFTMITKQQAMRLKDYIAKYAVTA